MPINELLAERHGGATPTKEKKPNDGRPDQSEPETTMRTGDWLPPYLHNQTLTNRSLVSLIATGLSIIWVLRKVV